MPRKPQQDEFTPELEHHFTFGLWTVGNVGRDPFGEPVRPPISPLRIVETHAAYLRHYERYRGSFAAARPVSVAAP